jgi:hypothetical protein
LTLPLFPELSPETDPENPGETAYALSFCIFHRFTAVIGWEIPYPPRQTACRKRRISGRGGGFNDPETDHSLVSSPLPELKKSPRLGASELIAKLLQTARFAADPDAFSSLKYSIRGADGGPGVLPRGLGSEHMSLQRAVPPQEIPVVGGQKSSRKASRLVIKPRYCSSQVSNPGVLPTLRRCRKRKPQGRSMRIRFDSDPGISRRIALRRLIRCTQTVGSVSGRNAKGLSFCNVEPIWNP